MTYHCCVKFGIFKIMISYLFTSNNLIPSANTLSMVFLTTYVSTTLLFLVFAIQYTQVIKIEKKKQ